MSLFDGDLSVALSRLTKSFGNSSNEIATLISNTRPFATQHKYPDLVEGITRIIESRDCVRSSTAFGMKLKEIIDACLVSRLECCWSMQSVKTRLDAIMKLIIPFIVTPHLSSLLGGEAGLSGGGLSFLERTRTLVIEVFTYFIDAELAVFASGSDVSLDNARARLLTSLLLFKCNSFSLLPVVVAEYTPSAMLCLCQHLLGVTALCEDVTVSVTTLCEKLVMVILEGDNGGNEARRDVTHIQREQQNKVNTLTMKSELPHDARKERSEQPGGGETSSRSPLPTSAQHIHTSLQRLLPHLMDYFQWLRGHRVSLVKLCRIVEVVECVHPSLRSSLHNESYTSSHDIVAKYLSTYKAHLTRIPLPLQPFRRNDVKQAIRDVSRESFVLNGEHLEGAHLLEGLFLAIRTHFISDHEEAQNEVQYPHTSAIPPPTGPGLGIGTCEQPHSRNDVLTASSVGGGCDDDSKDTVIRPSSPFYERTRSLSNSSIGEGSFYRPIALEHILEELHMQNTPPIPTVCDGTPTIPASLPDSATSTGPINGQSCCVSDPLPPSTPIHTYSTPTRSYRQVGIDFIELMLRFLLIGLSRTYSSGDAFFVIEDLFGGEGLCLCGPNNHTQKTMMKATTVKITSTAIVVEVCQHYHLYHSDSIGSDETAIRPLISFEAKIVTHISFKSVLHTHHYHTQQQVGGGYGHVRCVGEVSSRNEASGRAVSSLPPQARVPPQDDGLEYEVNDSHSAKADHSCTEQSTPTRIQLLEMFTLLTSCPEKVCFRALTVVPYILRDECAPSPGRSRKVTKVPTSSRRK